MKRIALCFDGTWQSVDDPVSVSNVVRVAQAIKAVATGDVEQITYYQAGVGSDGGIDGFLGGVFGVGLRNNVKRALAFLSLNYTEQDEIYIFGFSRGAYTARAVAGVIGAIGGIPMQEHFDKLEDFWNYYRIDPKVRNADTDKACQKKWDIRNLCLPGVPGEYPKGPGNYPKDLKKAVEDLGNDATRIIKCVGVWDTVGSYGVPSGYGLDGLARRFTSWTKGFHDQEFGKHAQIGLHALAIDERRRGFPPTAWRITNTPLDPDQLVEQVWFAGAHSNVGGSYRCSGLSDLALIWMMARVEDAAGLEFDKDVIQENFWPCATCSLYNSVPPWMVVSRLFPHRREVLSDRPLGSRDGSEQKYLNEMVHWSVLERRGRIGVCDETRYRPYRPRNLPKDIPKARTAEKTKKEQEFIDACSRTENERMKGCVMARQLNEKKRNRRARRLAKLQASWPATSLIRLRGGSEKGEGSI